MTGKNTFQQCELYCDFVVHTDHLEYIYLHVKSHSDSSWSLDCWYFKPQPSYCGLSNNRAMLSLSTIVCVDISSSVIKAYAWHRNYDCSQAWEADMRSLMFLKAFIARGH